MNAETHAVADAIRQTSETLNKLIRDAAFLGLRVDVDLRGIRVNGLPEEYQQVKVEVYQRL